MGNASMFNSVLASLFYLMLLHAAFLIQDTLVIQCIDTLMMQWIWLYVSVRYTLIAKENSGMISPARAKIHLIAQLLVCTLVSAWTFHLSSSFKDTLQKIIGTSQDEFQISLQCTTKITVSTSYSRTAQSLETTFTNHHGQRFESKLLELA